MTAFSNKLIDQRLFTPTLLTDVNADNHVFSQVNSISVPLIHTGKSLEKTTQTNGMNIYTRYVNSNYSTVNLILSEVLRLNQD